MRSARKIKLDHFRWAGPHQEQHADIRPALDQARYHAVQFFIRVRQPSEITFFNDGGRETGLGENHDAGGGLQQMRAGAAADHQEKRILNLTMQPDNAGQAAENLALTAFPQNGRIGAAGGLSRNALGLRRCAGKAHVIWPASPPRQLVSARRAARSFRTN